MAEAIRHLGSCSIRLRDGSVTEPRLAELRLRWQTCVAEQDGCQVLQSTTFRLIRARASMFGQHMPWEGRLRAEQAQ
jgi:hypothetical protein